MAAFVHVRTPKVDHDVDAEKRVDQSVHEEESNASPRHLCKKQGREVISEIIK